MKITLTGSGAPTVRSCVKCVKDCHEDAVTLRAELIELVETVASKDNRITDLTSELQDVKNVLFKATHKTDEARDEIEKVATTEAERWADRLNWLHTKYGADCCRNAQFNEVDPVTDNIIACDDFHGTFNPETMTQESTEKGGS